jgi:hypothetical protein
MMPPSEASIEAKPVTFPLEARDEAAGDGIAHLRKNDRDRLRLPLEGNGRRGRVCHDDVGLQADQLPRERWYPIGVIAMPPSETAHAISGVYFPFAGRTHACTSKPAAY